MPVGDYKWSDLQAHGILNDDISSIKITDGFQITAYWDDKISFLKIFSTSALKSTDKESINVEPTINNNVRIFPNPVENILNIAGITENVKIEIYNVDGRKVLEAQSEKDIDVSGLKAGIYFTKIYVNSGITTLKFKKN